MNDAKWGPRTVKPDHPSKERCCRAATALIAAAALAWLAFVAAAYVLDGREPYVALGIAGALSVVALAVSMRQIASGSVRTVVVAVEQAPRQSFWRGYEARGADMAATDVDPEDTVDLMMLGRR